MNTAHDQFTAQLLQALPALRRYCYSLTGNVANADDLLQSAAEKALKRWQQYEPGTHFDRWLYRLCRNLWIDQIRRDKPTEELKEGWQEDIALDQKSVSLEHEIEQTKSLASVYSQMNNLSSPLRSVLYLIAVEGRSYQEAAEILEIPTGTVMSRLSRARQQLSNAFGGTGDLL